MEHGRERPTRRRFRACGIAFGLAVLTVAAADAREPWRGPFNGGAGPLASAVGIRITPVNVDPNTLMADFDLTAYTRGIGPGGFIGSPISTVPAIDYGDGSTLSTTIIALSSIGGGPGGSNVYRSLASFTHTYPAMGTYEARTAMICVYCLYVRYASFPPGSPVPTTFTQTLDSVPATVIGNLAGRNATAGTFYYPPDSTSIVFSLTYYYYVTNRATVPLFVPIPTTSEWGLAGLGAALLLTGLVLIRRTA